MFSVSEILNLKGVGWVNCTQTMVTGRQSDLLLSLQPVLNPQNISWNLHGQVLELNHRLGGNPR